MICRLWGVLFLAFAVSSPGCGATPGAAQSREFQNSSKVEQPATTEKKPSAEPPRSSPAKSRDAQQEIEFSEPTREAIFGLPLVINFPDLPEVPEKIRGPSPPIRDAK